MEKELENSEKKKRRKQPKPAQSAQPSHAPVRSRHLTGGPRLSAAVLLRARPPSLARCPVGPTCQRQLSSLCALPFSVSWARSASRRVIAPHAPFSSLCAVDPTCQFRPLRARHGPARAHSRTSPDFSATTPAHAPSSLLRAPPVPHAHPSPHFVQLRPLSRSAHAASRHWRPTPGSWPSNSPETAPSLPELRPKVRHPSPCLISLIAPCARPILPSLVLGRGGPPCSRDGQPI
jgi:hypothetical protein